MTTKESKYLIINVLRKLCELKSVCINASNLDLSETKFENQSFLVTDFCKSNLSRVSFERTKFYFCDFSETILQDCDFSGSEIRFSIFENCKEINKAKFAFTHITNDNKSYLESVLSEKQLRNIIWIDSKETFQDYKIYFKASISSMDKLKNRLSEVL